MNKPGSPGLKFRPMPWQYDRSDASQNRFGYWFQNEIAYQLVDMCGYFVLAHTYSGWWLNSSELQSANGTWGMFFFPAFGMETHQKNVSTVHFNSSEGFQPRPSGLVVIQPLFSFLTWSETSHSHASPSRTCARAEKGALGAICVHWPQFCRSSEASSSTQQYPAVALDPYGVSIKSWWLVKLMDTTWWIWWIRRETSTGKYVSFACVYPKSWGLRCVQIFPETILNQSNEYK